MNPWILDFEVWLTSSNFALMSVENLSLVREAYVAHTRGDHAAIFAFLHPEVEITQTSLLPWGGTHRGHEGARTFFQKLAEHTEAMPEPTEYIPAGDDVAVYGRLKGRARKSGRAIDLAIIHVWTLKDGKAVKFTAYIDTPAMLTALG